MDANRQQQAKVTLMSFGFKYGIPSANYYFDVGFVQNPARAEGWDFFSHPNKEMHDYVVNQPEASAFLDKLEPLLIFLSRIDQNQIFALGCNAGRHRSSILVEELACRMEKAGVAVTVQHRDRDV